MRYIYIYIYILYIVIDDINNNKLENFGELDPDLSKIIKEIAYTPQVKNNEGLMPDELLGYIKDYPKFTMELHETITKAKKALLGKKFDFDEIKKEYLGNKITIQII